jgi:hypothetical protein
MSFYFVTYVILLFIRNVMEFHIFRKVSGCVVDACKVQAGQSNVVSVRIEEELSNKQTMGDGLMLFVGFGFLRLDSLTRCFWNLLTALITYHQPDGN